MSFDVARTTEVSDPARLAALADTSPTASTQALPAATTGYVPEPSYHPGLLGLQPQAPANATPARATSFDAEVRGQDPQAVDLDLMEISDAVYDPNVRQVGDWTRLDDSQLLAAGIDPATLENPETGFRAGIFTDGEGRHVLAYAGSNEWQDWTGANFAQGLGWQSEQFDQAVELAQLADAAFGDDLVITGHSLGGGLAATAAFATGNAAVTFNASGVHDNTIERLGLDPAAAFADAEAGLVRRYNIEGEMLTAAQQDIWVVNGIPDAPGHEIVLDDPNPLTGWDRFNPIAIFNHSKDLHMQGSVLEALREQQPWN